ncbi:MAG: substrate-binding periplasmic protein [Desulfamplus sp.]
MRNINFKYSKYIIVIIGILLIITAIFYGRSYIPHNHLPHEENSVYLPLPDRALGQTDNKDNSNQLISENKNRAAKETTTATVGGNGRSDSYNSSIGSDKGSSNGYNSSIDSDKGSSDSDDIITVHYHEKPPYYVTGDFGVYGLCAERATQIFQSADIRFKWQKTPAPRQLDIIRSNKSRDCGIGWYKNPEREKFAKYSLPFYQDSYVVALKLANSHKEIVSGKPIKELLSNPELTFLLKSGYSYGQFVDNSIALFSPKRIVTTLEPIGMLKMISLKRADYFFISEDEAESIIKISGFSESEFDLIKFSDMPEGNKRYLIFSNRIEDETIEKINAAIRLYKYDKTIPKNSFKIEVKN